MLSKLVKIVFTVPESHADILRQVVGEAGAGQIGNCSFCSISSKVTERFLPNQNAHPTIGNVGNLEAVEEERIEIQCERTHLFKVITKIKAHHPYEEVALDIYPLENIPIV